MVGHMPLEHVILVRVQAPQQNNVGVIIDSLLFIRLIYGKISTT